MKFMTVLILLALTVPALACPPNAAQQYAPPAGYMLVPILRQQPMQYAPQAYAPPVQCAPRAAMYAAPAAYAAPVYAAPAMAYAAPRGAYASGGGVAVSVTHQRAILPRNRSTTVNVAGGGMAASVQVGRGRGAAACAT